MLCVLVRGEVSNEDEEKENKKKARVKYSSEPLENTAEARHSVPGIEVDVVLRLSNQWPVIDTVLHEAIYRWG